MTLVQEASQKMESLSEDSIRIIIALIDRMQPAAKKKNETSASKKTFLKTAGKIEIDEAAVSELRVRSMI